MMTYISDISSAAVQLTTSAFAQLFFWPSTKKSYIRMFADFMISLVLVGLLPSQVNVHHLLTFMEYLCQNQNFSCKYLELSGWPPSLLCYSLSSAPFTDKKIKMCDRSLKINRPLVVKNTSVFTYFMLVEILAVTSNLEEPLVFTALYLLAFFSLFCTFKCGPS